MSEATELAADLGLRQAGRKSRWPARLDVAQSATGLALALFMWVHLCLVSSILLGRDAMWTVARFFEGQFVFGRAHPWIVSVAVAGILVLLVLHAALALRKFPINHRQYAMIRGHMRLMHHEDTTLWFWQVATGFALFFMATVHLYLIGSRPERIGPFESADRVWTEVLWPLYIVMLFAVELHGGIGLYRIAIKWGWLADRDAARTRRRLRTFKWTLTGLFLALGVASLVAYVRIGVEHAPHYGEPYLPSWAATAPGGAQ